MTATRKKLRLPKKSSACKKDLRAKKRPKAALLHGAASFGSAKAGKGTAKPIKRRKRLPGLKELRAAGLPTPASLKPSSADFKKLQAKWYSKLAEDGFEDLESNDYGKILNSNYLKGGAGGGRIWSPERAQFYRLLQNYVTHYKFKKKLDKFIMTMLNDGATYRQIHKACRAGHRHRLRKSLWWVFHYVKKLVESMIAWNTTSSEGLLNPANADSWASDALLTDLSGRAGVLEAPNGLKLDQGWWAENAANWWNANGGH